MGWLLYMAILVAAAFLLVHFVGERTVVSGDSMSPTLSDGDNLILAITNAVKDCRPKGIVFVLE